MTKGDASEEEELANTPQSNSTSDDFQLIQVRVSNKNDEAKRAYRSNESDEDANKSEGTSNKNVDAKLEGNPDDQSRLAQKKEQLHTPNYKLTKAQIESLDAWVMSAVQGEQDTGLQFTDTLHKTRAFNNPGIYEEMITYCKLDAYGSETKNNTKLQADEYCEELIKIQEEQMRERAGNNP